MSFRPAPHAAARSCLATFEIMTGVAMAHTWAGGQLPSLPWLSGLTGLVFGSTLLVLHGKARLRTMVLGLGVAQFMLHGFLAAMAPTQHVHGGAAAPVLHLTWQMAAAHGVSALLTALVWVARRRALEAIICWPDLFALSPGLVTSPPPRADDWRPLVSGWLSGAPRRGPPTRVLCV